MRPRSRASEWGIETGNGRETREEALTTSLLWVQEQGPVLLESLSPKRSQLTLSHQRARKLWHLPTSSPDGQRHAPEHGPRTMGREHLRHRKAGSYWPGWHLPAGNFQDRETVIEIQSPSVRMAPSSLHP